MVRVPRAGLAESTLELLRAAVADGEAVARFRAKIRVVPGSACHWWSHAVSGRGHGRFWLGAVDGRDVVVIAHRFAWALEFGVDALEEVPVFGHRCDNPLCQRIGPGHVEASSAWRNRQEWVMRRDTIGGPLRDARGARGRSRALRDAVRRDPTSVSLSTAIVEGMAADAAQVPLWGPGSLDVEVEQSRRGRRTEGLWANFHLGWVSLAVCHQESSHLNTGSNHPGSASVHRPSARRHAERGRELRDVGVVAG